MSDETPKKLKERIKEEMLADYSNALEKNFDLAKQFVQITNEGNVNVLVKNQVNGKYQILLYLIGKLYAKEVNFTHTEDVSSKELMNELGIREGSLRPWIKELRDKKRINQIKKNRYTHYVIPMNLIESTLKEVEEKIKKTH